MKKCGLILFSMIVLLLSIESSLASQVGFETWGDVNVVYASSVGGIAGSDEGGFDQDSPVSQANVNVNGYPGAGMNGFTMARTNGLNNVGASAGIMVNRHPFSGTATNPFEPPKDYVAGSSTATATATNRYYFSGGAPIGMPTPISMGFSYDGVLNGVMRGLDIGNMGGAGGYISYSVQGSVWSEGYWNPEGIGWRWSFTERDQFDLMPTLGVGDEIDGYVWENGSGQRLGDELAIGGYEEMNLEVFAAEYLKNAVFYASYTIVVDVVLDGLAFEEGGYLYAKSDFYNTMAVSVLSPGTVSAQPFDFDGNNAVPEPNTFFLLGLGLLGVAGFSRRKN